MSQHIYKTAYHGQPIEILLGYDKPMDGYFMVIEFTDPAIDDDFYLYSNLFEDEPFVPTLDRYLAVLSNLGITLPQPIIEEVLEDGRNKAGSKCVLHSIGNKEYVREVIR